MYGIPTGPMPITGASLLGFALIGAALIAGGLVSLRLAYFANKRRTRRSAGTRLADLPPGRPQ
jgi:hypothetical protein